MSEASGPTGWLRGVIFDARDPEALSRFWSALLGVPLDEQLSQPPGWYELDPGPTGIVLGFQPVTGERPRPSIRLDVEVTDLDEGQRRAEALGACFVAAVHFNPGEEHRVFADPEGNEFNLVLPFPVPPANTSTWPPPGVQP